MPTLTGTFVVQRPQQEVFEYLTQVTRHAEWSPKAFRVEGDPGPIALGSTWTSFGWIPGDKNHRNEARVSEFSPPSRITWETTEEAQAGRFATTFVLTPEGSGTKVERIFEFPAPTGPVRMVWPLISAMIVKPGFNKGVSMLQQRLEAGSGASASA
jgi:uncharacterized protein YndB with AHSA1/START domain